MVVSSIADYSILLSLVLIKHSIIIKGLSSFNNKVKYFMHHKNKSKFRILYKAFEFEFNLSKTPFKILTCQWFNFKVNFRVVK